jgi:hypothetical protein
MNRQSAANKMGTRPPEQLSENVGVAQLRMVDRETAKIAQFFGCTYEEPAVCAPGVKKRQV